MASLKPLIGITSRIVTAPNYDEKRDAFSHDLITFLEKLDFSPIIIPNTISKISEFLDQFPISGFILSGGDNIGDSPERDKTEKDILKYATKKNLFVFGICRGMQVINNFFGGTISKNDTNSHLNIKHSLNISTERIKNFFSDNEIIVNSYHNNIINSTNLANDLIPFAIHKDNTIEGFFHDTFPIYAVMWHPERDSSDNSLSLIKKIFAQNID